MHRLRQCNNKLPGNNWQIQAEVESVHYRVTSYAECQTTTSRWRRLADILLIAST